MTNDAKCIMVVGAHAADAEIMGGATVLKHIDAGWRAVIVHMTPGEKGHRSFAPEEYARIKVEEANNAARILGADCVMLPYKDGECALLPMFRRVAGPGSCRRGRPAGRHPRPAQSNHRRARRRQPCRDGMRVLRWNSPAAHPARPDHRRAGAGVRGRPRLGAAATGADARLAARRVVRPDWPTLGLAFTQPT